MKALLRRLVLRPLVHPGVARCFLSLTRDRVPTFIMHRFRDAELGNDGFDPQALRSHLAFLRRQGFRILSLSQLVSLVRGEASLTRKAVCFTVDDGYRDFVRICAPIFREFDAPVALFVATGFVDGHYWPWWDRVEYILTKSEKPALSLDLPQPSPSSDPNEGHNRPQATYTWSLTEDGLRKEAIRALVGILKSLPEDTREASIRSIEGTLEISAPSSAPQKYQPATWDELREAASLGATLAPHSVTHRNMAQCTEAEVLDEVEESYRRLKVEIGRPPPVFAFPFGLRNHLGTVSPAAFRGVGLEMAFSAMPGYVERNPTNPFRLPRFSCPEDRETFVRITFGLERLREAFHFGSARSSWG